ncbi:MAG TPA: DUF2510 domain-containing protein [Pseudolysinimonas sp.]|nr:DUF2510 domain-containing protein [Pseudolysinimonas sp.]
MTDQATRVVPAGWYEDPASTAHLRWWNGLAWTEHITAKPTSDPQPTNLSRIAEARDLERQYGISTAENDILVLAATADGSATTAAETTSGYRPWSATPEPELEEPGTSTASAWFIALWPVLTLAAAATAAYLAFYVMPEPSVAGIPVVAAIAIVPTLLTLIWAATDARKLRSLGHRAASPALAFLGPLVYLIGRRARVAGSRPLVTLIILTLIAVGVPTAAYLTGYAAPVTKALEIQQAVQADLVGSGELASVSCPVFVENLAPGSLYTCNGVLPNGRAKLVWVSIDSVDGDFTYALAVR